MSSTPITAAPCSWYVVQCQPTKERQAAVALHDQFQVNVYVPQLKRRGRGKQRGTPLFPSYVFVQTDLRVVPPSKINATQGVQGVVVFDQQPQPIPAAMIEAIRQRVDQLNEQGGFPQHQFRPGDPITITRGPLRGLDAIFEGPMKANERIRVLIDFLGQLRKVDVPVDAVEPLASAPVAKRPRRTRGKGRVITPKTARNDPRGYMATNQP